MTMKLSVLLLATIAFLPSLIESQGIRRIRESSKKARSSSKSSKASVLPPEAPFSSIPSFMPSATSSNAISSSQVDDKVRQEGWPLPRLRRPVSKRSEKAKTVLKSKSLKSSKAQDRFRSQRPTSMPSSMPTETDSMSYSMSMSYFMSTAYSMSILYSMSMSTSISMSMSLSSTPMTILSAAPTSMPSTNNVTGVHSEVSATDDGDLYP